MSSDHRRAHSRSRSPRGSPVAASRRRPRANASRAATHRRSPPRTPTATATVLPAAAHREELLTALRSHQVVVCVGETGSGKTTQLPQYLLAALAAKSLVEHAPSDRIVVTQPRRVATVAVAQRVAEEMGFSRLAGSPVGYAIRFDDQTSASTRLKFVTDGVLVRECLSDPTLSKYAVVVLDEAHERSLHTDILLGLLKQALARRRDLRLLVTSATLDAARFVAFFARLSDQTASVEPSAVPPVVQIPGRMFPVDIFHSKQTQVMGLRGPLSTYVRAAVETALQIHHSEEPGHILVFLTGQHEIEDACAQLRRLDREKGDGREMKLKVLPLYGALSGHAQRDIFRDVPSYVRKVIVATNIAETSLTVDGIRYVVDCGFTKQKVYNPEKQLESLVVVPISKVSAQQRAGRAGRTAPGKCYRLYSKESYMEMLDESIPEIRRTNLTNTVLYLKLLGVHNVLAFDLLDRPEEDALLDALRQLYELDAIDDGGHVTMMGKLMAQFPLEPKHSRALIQSLALDCGDDMATVVAMLSVENVYAQPKQRNKKACDETTKHDDGDETLSRDELMVAFAREDLIDDRGDQLTYLRLYKAFERLQSQQRQHWCETHDLRYRALSTASSIRRQLLDIVASLPSEDLSVLRLPHWDSALRKRSHTTRLRASLCAGFFSNAVRRCNHHSSVYRPMETETESDSPGGHVQLIHLHPLSTLNYVTAPMFCVYHELVATNRPYMRDVVVVEQQWVREHVKPPLVSAQLYGLSGAVPPTTLKTSTSGKRKRRMENEATPSRDVAPTNQVLKQDTIHAARERFLARKKGQN